MSQPDIYSLLGDSSRRTADMAADLAMQSRQLFDELLNIGIEQDTIFGQRASRVIPLALAMRQEWIRSIEERVILLLPHLHNNSVVRNFLQIFETLTIPEDEELLGLLVSFCFNVVEKGDRPVSVDVKAMTILRKAAARYPELGDELVIILNERMEEGNPAICSRARHIMKELKR